MAEQLPAPLYDPADMEGQRFQVHFIQNDELVSLSIDQFRETGRNYSEWAEDDPVAAYHALRRAVADKRHQGNLGAVAEAGLQAQFSEPTTISIRVHRPTIRQLLLGKPADAKRSQEIARFKFAQEDGESQSDAA